MLMMMKCCHPRLLGVTLEGRLLPGGSLETAYQRIATVDMLSAIKTVEVTSDHSQSGHQQQCNIACTTHHACGSPVLVDLAPTINHYPPTTTIATHALPKPYSCYPLRHSIHHFIPFITDSIHGVFISANPSALDCRSALLA